MCQRWDIDRLCHRCLNLCRAFGELRAMFFWFVVTWLPDRWFRVIFQHVVRYCWSLSEWTPSAETIIDVVSRRKYSMIISRNSTSAERNKRYVWVPVCPCSAGCRIAAGIPAFHFWQSEKTHSPHQKLWTFPTAHSLISWSASPFPTILQASWTFVFSCPPPYPTW